MRCAILSDSGAYVDASAEGADERMADLRAGQVPMTLILRKPVPMERLYAAGYSADNTLHAFVNATDGDWAAPYLAAAGRCGIHSAVTLYPVYPGAVQCADVLETVAALCVNYRMTFLFMFPCIPNGARVNERYVSRDGSGRAVPTAEYVARFMAKVHKYTDCTACRCGVCGKDCTMCTEPVPRPVCRKKTTNRKKPA